MFRFPSLYEVTLALNGSKISANSVIRIDYSSLFTTTIVWFTALIA